MKVLHFGWSDLAPGAASASYRLHRALMEAGLDSAMLVADRRSDDPTVYGPKSRAARIRARLAHTGDANIKRAINRFSRATARDGRPLLDRDTSLSIMGSGLIKKIPRLDPDLVHLHWLCGGLVRPESLRFLSNRPVVWTLHDMWPFSGVEHYAGASVRYQTGYQNTDGDSSLYPMDINRWMWSRKKKALDSVSRLAVVAPSLWMATCAQRSALFRDRRVEMIHHGIDVEVFKPGPRAEARRSLNLPIHEKVVLFGAVAALDDPRKGFHLLLETLKQLEALERSPFRIVIFGANRPDRPLPLSSPITFLGELAQEQLAAAYNAATIFVAPSSQEAFGQTVVEALACGTPVVAFDTASLPELIEHQRIGYLARPFETKELANGISRFLEDDDSESSLVRDRARARVLEHFDREKQARKHIELYEELISEELA